MCIAYSYKYKIASHKYYLGLSKYFNKLIKVTKLLSISRLFLILFIFLFFFSFSFFFFFFFCQSVYCILLHFFSNNEDASTKESETQGWCLETRRGLARDGQERQAQGANAKWWANYKEVLKETAAQNHTGISRKANCAILHASNGRVGMRQIFYLFIKKS